MFMLLKITAHSVFNLALAELKNYNTKLF